MTDVSRLFESLAALGISPKMQTFAERKRVQKTVYLLDKVFGMNFGYCYNWYLHGPYSPQVTQLVFDVVERGNQVDANPNNLSPEDICRIDRMKLFLGNDLYSNDMLELLVSVDYLLDCPANTQSKEQEIMQFLNIKKPYFSNQQIIAAIRRMQALRESH